MAAPQGQVFLVNVTNNPPTIIDTTTLDVNGNYSFTESNLPVGTYNVQAQYQGRGQDQPSNSPIVEVTVNPPSLPTSTSLDVAPNPSSQGQNVVFSGQVTQP